MPYADDERRALLAFALGVYSDPNASPADREAARRRLTADTRAPDWKRLTTGELVQLTNAIRTGQALLAFARGEAYKAPELAIELPKPVRVDAHHERAVEPTATPTSAPEVTAEPVPSEQPAQPVATEPRRFKLADILRVPLVRR